MAIVASYKDELEKLATLCHQLTYKTCVLEGATASGGLSGAIVQAIISLLSDLGFSRTYEKSTARQG